MSTLSLKGVLPPMITPFTAEGDVDTAAFAANVGSWNEQPLAGYLVNGSNSETAYLTEEEKLELVRITVEQARPGRHIMAGTGMESLRETIRFTNACARLGAHSALVLTPCYYDAAMTSTVLIDFFTGVADASDIPILIYNVPKFTHVNVKPDAVAALCKHPNIVGMKDSTGDIPQMATWRRIVGDEDFTLIVGTASAWYPALALGVETAVLALANCHPAQCAAVQRAFDAGDWKRARDIYQALFPVNAAVTGTYGIPGLKHACDFMGLRGGHVRRPLPDASAETKDAVERIVKAAGGQLAALGL